MTGPNTFPPWLTNGQGSLKLTPSLNEKILSNYTYLAQTEKPINPREFMESVIDQLLEYKDIPPGRDPEAVRLIEQENQQLKIQLQEAQAAAPPDPTQSQQYQDLLAQNQDLQTQLDDKPDVALKPGQVILTIPPELKPFIDHCIAKEQKRTGQQISAQKLLLNLFWQQVKEGAGDHLPKVFSNSEINRLLKKVKDEQTVKQGDN